MPVSVGPGAGRTTTGQAATSSSSTIAAIASATSYSASWRRRFVKGNRWCYSGPTTRPRSPTLSRSQWSIAVSELRRTPIAAWRPSAAASNGTWSRSRSDPGLPRPLRASLASSERSRCAAPCSTSGCGRLWAARTMARPSRSRARDRRSSACRSGRRSLARLASRNSVGSPVRRRMCARGPSSSLRHGGLRSCGQLSRATVSQRSAVSGPIQVSRCPCRTARPAGARSGRAAFWPPRSEARTRS